MHDGLIPALDTGLGKSIYGFAWALLKTGWTVVPRTESRLPSLTRHLNPEKTTGLRPNAPVLLIVPGDLHQQIALEGWEKFRVDTRVLDSQDAFQRLCSGAVPPACVPHPNHTAGTDCATSPLPNLDAEGKPVLPPDFYITSYSQLTTNGVTRLPDPLDWPKPRELLAFACLPEHESQSQNSKTQKAPSVSEFMSSGSPSDPPDEFSFVAQVFTWRQRVWRDDYDLLQVHKDDTRPDLDRAFLRERDLLSTWEDPKAAANALRKLETANARLQNLFTYRACPQYAELTLGQQDFVIREFLRGAFERYAAGIGTERAYPQGPIPVGYDPLKPETDTRPKWRIKCVYTPSLADLCYNAFAAVVIDEGVKMKGEDTFVGRGVRSMEAPYRCVLTATPIKNRLPDIFRLAWWATGGQAEAHARFPYRDDRTERDEFAKTFMVAERNLTKEAAAKQQMAEVRRQRADYGRPTSDLRPPTSGRFTKLTAEICNVHRLWKLLAPIVLRRRKDECGEDIVPTIRKVIRVEPGTRQQKVYRYHLEAPYLDVNGDKAIGAQLQSLRIAAADPSSTCLPDKGVLVVEELCRCRLPLPAGEGRGEGERPANRKLRNTCPHCAGQGVVKVALPHRAANPYVPKLAATLELIREILERQEQVVVFSAFNDPLDFLSGLLRDARVPHLQLDGRTGQQKRGVLAAQFKAGREAAGDLSWNGMPVLLAGVECMAEGHSFHLCNNVILIAYSWAYDKFKQALDRVHRLNSEKPVNVYVVICNGTVDRKLESLVQEKTDSVELALDGRLIGERTEDVSLAELLAVARAEFDPGTVSVDEAAIQAAWPALRQQLRTAALAWPPARPVSALFRPSPVRQAAPETPEAETGDWREAMRALAAQLRREQRGSSTGSDLWAAL